jgi:DNA-binding LacI/PurR family transcriptional regulator
LAALRTISNSVSSSLLPLSAAAAARCSTRPEQVSASTKQLVQALVTPLRYRARDAGRCCRSRPRVW